MKLNVKYKGRQSTIVMREARSYPPHHLVIILEVMVSAKQFNYECILFTILDSPLVVHPKIYVLVVHVMKLEQDTPS